MDESDAYRSACETRWLAAQPEFARIEYCRLVTKHRGREAAEALYRAARSLADPAATQSAPRQVGSGAMR